MYFSGLEKACFILMAESESMSHLVYRVNSDRTASVHVALTTPPLSSTPANDNTTDVDLPDTQRFIINMYPVYVLDKPPSQLHVHAPLPGHRRYIASHRQFKQHIETNIVKGATVAILDPKVCLLFK